MKNDALKAFYRILLLHCYQADSAEQHQRFQYEWLDEEQQSRLLNQKLRGGRVKSELQVNAALAELAI